MCVLCFFCFKQRTAYEMRISDWSSDVCSSDLGIESLKPLHDAFQRHTGGKGTRGCGKRIAQVMHARRRQGKCGAANWRMDAAHCMGRLGMNLVGIHIKIRRKSETQYRACSSQLGP